MQSQLNGIEDIVKESTIWDSFLDFLLAGAKSPPIKAVSSFCFKALLVILSQNLEDKADVKYQ